MEDKYGRRLVAHILSFFLSSLLPFSSSSSFVVQTTKTTQILFRLLVLEVKFLSAYPKYTDSFYLLRQLDSLREWSAPSKAWAGDFGLVEPIIDSALSVARSVLYFDILR